MRKANYITFLILLVPRLQAQVENVTKLIEEIDKFYGELDCPEGLLKPIVVDIMKVRRNPIPKLDFATQLNVYARYLLLTTILGDPVFAKRCGHEGSSNELLALPRTFGLIADIWRHKLCFILHYRCTANEPSSPIIIEKQVNEIHVENNPEVPTVSEQTHATCTPFDQHILLPNGKVEKQQQLNCVFPNKTTVIVPMQELENNSKPPGQAPSPGGKLNLNALPNVFVLAETKVNVDSNLQKS